MNDGETLRSDFMDRRVAAPVDRRMNLLRTRVGICSSAL
jgi:hypothetical protein